MSDKTNKGEWGYFDHKGEPHELETMFGQVPKRLICVLCGRVETADGKLVRGGRTA